MVDIWVNCSFVAVTVTENHPDQYQWLTARLEHNLPLPELMTTQLTDAYMRHLALIALSIIKLPFELATEISQNLAGLRELIFSTVFLHHDW